MRVSSVLAFCFGTIIAACGASPEPGTQTETAPPAPTQAAPSSPPEAPPPGDLRAGVGVADITPSVGAPLAGYTHRRRLVPELDPSTAAKFFGPSTGVRDPLHARALVVESGGKRVAFVTVDAIAMLGDMVDRIVDAAHAKGSKLQREDLVVSASHSHSSSGSLSGLHFWEQIATDELVPSLRDAFISSCADAVISAEQGLVPARAGFGWGEVSGATKNRRANLPKTKFDASSIDKTLAVLRVDTTDGKPLATLVNFAIHPTTLTSSSMVISADVVGGIAAHVEKLTGAPMLFANGAEGDIAPVEETEAAIGTIGSLVGQKVVEVREATSTRDRLRLQTANADVDFGKAKLNARPDTLSSGALDLSVLGSAGAIDLGPDQVDHVFRFQAIRIDDDVIATVPGEPIHTLGLRIRAEGQKLGFGHVLVFGLSNGHMSYVTDSDEYDAGGYEAAATLFGRDTGDRVVTSSAARLQAVSGK